MSLPPSHFQIAGVCVLILASLTGMVQARALAPIAEHSRSKLASAKDAIPPCTPPPIRKSRRNQPQHSVTLSWHASIPASKSGKDAVKGYYVYRSQASHTYASGNRLHAAPIEGTSCVDRAVEPRAIYYYTVRAVSVSGAQSALSDEVKAVIPFP